MSQNGVVRRGGEQSLRVGLHPFFASVAVCVSILLAGGLGLSTFAAGSWPVSAPATVSIATLLGIWVGSLNVPDEESSAAQVTLVFLLCLGSALYAGSLLAQGVGPTLAVPATLGGLWALTGAPLSPLFLLGAAGLTVGMAAVQHVPLAPIAPVAVIILASFAVLRRWLSRPDPQRRADALFTFGLCCLVPFLEGLSNGSYLFSGTRWLIGVAGAALLYRWYIKASTDEEGGCFQLGCQGPCLAPIVAFPLVGLELLGDSLHHSSTLNQLLGLAGVCGLAFGLATLGQWLVAPSRGD